MKNVITQILQENHDIPISGHLGRDKTYERITRNYYWPKMYKDVKKYINSYDSYQKNKNNNQPTAGLL